MLVALPRRSTCAGSDRGHRTHTTSAAQAILAVVRKRAVTLAPGAIVGVGVYLFTRHWLVRALALTYPALVVLTIVVTGNHFVFDAAAGVAVMGVGFWAAARVRAWWDRRADLGWNGAILRHATQGGAVR